MHTAHRGAHRRRHGRRADFPDSLRWAAFDQARPSILGAVLDAVVTAMRRYHEVKLDRLPRMADIAMWATAAEPALCLDQGQFMAAYHGNREGANELVLESSPIARHVLHIAQEGGCEATSSDWLAQRESMATEGEKRLRTWPKSAKGLTGTRKRLAGKVIVAEPASFWRVGGL